MATLGLLVGYMGWVRQGARRMHLSPIHCCPLLEHKLTLVWGTHTVLTHTSQFLTWHTHTWSLQSLPFSRTHTRAHSGPFGVGRRQPPPGDFSLPRET